MRTTQDASGNEVKRGDIVALYGYLDDDGYNADPELDQRERGAIRTTRVCGILKGGHIRDENGHIWPRWDFLLVRSVRA